MTLAYILAYEQLSRWRAWKIFSENDIARMAEVEKTSDLVMLPVNQAATNGGLWLV
jgi:hypothetical protein